MTAYDIGGALHREVQRERRVIRAAEIITVAEISGIEVERIENQPGNAEIILQCFDLKLLDDSRNLRRNPAGEFHCHTVFFHGKPQNEFLRRLIHPSGLGTEKPGDILTAFHIAVDLAEPRFGVTYDLFPVNGKSEFISLPSAIFIAGFQIDKGIGKESILIPAEPPGEKTVMKQSRIFGAINHF